MRMINIKDEENLSLWIKPEPSKHLGFIYMLGSWLFLALQVVLMKESFLIQKELSGFDAHLYRGISMAVSTCFVCVFIKINIFYIKKGEWVTLILRCFFGTLTSLFYFWGFNYISVGIGNLIFHLSLPLQVFLGWAILNEKVWKI